DPAFAADERGLRKRAVDELGGPEGGCGPQGGVPAARQGDDVERLVDASFPEQGDRPVHCERRLLRTAGEPVEIAEEMRRLEALRHLRTAADDIRGAAQRRCVESP